MRIISGKFKGKKLSQPIDNNTRPLKDITKESIFNLITHSKYISLDFEKSNILDLFAGSGSFGLECLSRNAKHVTFVENYKPAVNVLKKNVGELKLINNYEIIEKDVFDKKIYRYLNRKYNLIFLDPPYKETKIQNLFSLILDLKLLKKNALVIIHRNKKIDDFIPTKFKIIDTRLYGISKIIFSKLR